MGAISAALQACRDRIEGACSRAARSSGCARLLAVSKTFTADAIREAHGAGQAAFGESYLQEALPKLQALADLALEWHFIGPLQSNKTRHVAENFAWVHAVDREKIAQRLSEQRPATLPPLNVCIQVNLSGEASKRGVSADRALPLTRALLELPRLRLRGFMTLPEASDDDALPRARFRTLAQLLTRARAEGMDLDTLSMGMSHDLEAAVEEGATIVRVGTAIFGARASGVAR